MQQMIWFCNDLICLYKYTSFELPEQVEAIQRNVSNICVIKKYQKKKHAYGKHY